MFEKAPSRAPRHMAGTKRAGRTHEPRGAVRAAHAAPLVEIDDELTEVPAPVRVRRSRVAFAISVTVASLPILVLDNFPATADTGESNVEAAGVAAEIYERPTITVEMERERGRVDAGLHGATTSTTAAVAPVTEAAPADPPVEETTTSTADSTDAPAPEPAAASLAAPAPAPTTTTTAAPAPARESSTYGDPSDPATWDRLAQCESHGRWDLNSGNGYYGGLQFSLATWRDVGGAGYPHEASREEQIKRGQMLQARYGWGQWPHCSSELGYR